MKKYYQLIYKEIGRIDGEYNESGTSEIFESEIKAWQHALIDCETDLDITYVFMGIANGSISVRELTSKEGRSLFERQDELDALMKFLDDQEENDRADDGVVGD